MSCIPEHDWELSGSGLEPPGLVLGENTVNTGTGARRQGQKKGTGASTLKRAKVANSPSFSYISRGELDGCLLCARGTEPKIPVTPHIILGRRDCYFYYPIFQMERVKL